MQTVCTSQSGGTGGTEGPLPPSIGWYFEMDDSSLISSHTTPVTWISFVKNEMFELIQVIFDHAQLR